MATTQFRGTQILDGTITAADIEDALEKEFTKVRVSSDDSSPNFLSLKLSAGDGISLSVIGASGSNQTLVISSSVPMGPAGATGPIGPTGPAGAAGPTLEAYSGAYTSTYVLRRTTSDGTPLDLTTNGLEPSGASNVLSISADTTVSYDIHVVARRTDAATGSPEGASYKINVAACRDSLASSTYLITGDYKVIIAESTPGWDVNVSADTTNGALRVTVTGQEGKIIKWTAFVREIRSAE